MWGGNTEKRRAHTCLEEPERMHEGAVVRTEGEAAESTTSESIGA